MSKTQRDLIKGIRKSMPPPQTAHKSRKRKKLEKIFKKEFQDAAGQ